LLAFTVGGLGIAFLIFNNPRSRFAHADVEPLDLPADVRVAPRWRQALGAMLLSLPRIEAGFYADPKTRVIYRR
jgi:hypothetical protein